MAIKKELIDELIASSEGSLIGPNGVDRDSLIRRTCISVKGDGVLCPF